MNECQYRKLRDGSWGVLGPVSMVAAGATVTVWKRDGSARTERIVEVASRPFDVDGVKCVYGRIERKEREKEVPSGGRCADCGKPLYGRSRACRDVSGIMGECCPTCARLPMSERSFE